MKTKLINVVAFSILDTLIAETENRTSSLIN